MITADNITDEQIRELKRRETERAVGLAGELRDVCVENVVECNRALAEVYGTDEVSRLLYRLHCAGLVDRARARCAEILNARKAVSK